MLKEITSKTKEEVIIMQGLIALIALAAFVIGLVIGILCSPKGKKRAKPAADEFDPDEYVRSLSFDDFEDHFDDSEKETMPF